MQNPLFYKNRLQRGDNLSLKFIVSLSQNLEYQKNLLKYWDQIGKNPQGKVLATELLEVITAIMKCLICLPDESLKQLSQQYLESMTDLDPNLPEYLGYHVFVDAITQLLFQLIIQPDLSSAIYLLKTIHARIYRRQLIDVQILHKKISFIIVWKLKINLPIDVCETMMYFQHYRQQIDKKYCMRKYICFFIIKIKFLFYIFVVIFYAKTIIGIWLL